MAVEETPGGFLEYKIKVKYKVGYNYGRVIVVAKSIEINLDNKEMI